MAITGYIVSKEGISYTYVFSGVEVRDLTRLLENQVSMNFAFCTGQVLPQANKSKVKQTCLFFIMLLFL